MVMSKGPPLPPPHRYPFSGMPCSFECYMKQHALCFAPVFLPFAPDWTRLEARALLEQILNQASPPKEGTIPVRIGGSVKTLNSPL